MLRGQGFYPELRCLHWRWGRCRLSTVRRGWGVADRRRWRGLAWRLHRRVAGWSRAASRRRGWRCRPGPPSPDRVGLRVRVWHSSDWRHRAFVVTVAVGTRLKIISWVPVLEGAIATLKTTERDLLEGSGQCWLPYWVVGFRQLSQERLFFVLKEADNKSFIIGNWN